MVSKITIFEPHFDGAQFGPASIGSVETTDETDSLKSDDTTQSGGRFRGRWMLGAGVLSFVLLAGTVAARRVRNPDVFGGELEEHAAAEISAR